MFQKEIIDAQRRIDSFIHRTPVLTSKSVDAEMGARLFFKCENFQKAGSFKLRGALNALLCLDDVQRARGVVTHSSGNFAQAISLTADTTDNKAYIVMPQNAPEVKKAAVRGYGGDLIECTPTLAAREQTTKEIIASHKATFIHPSNDLNVIFGHATAAKELLENQPDLDYLFVPVGGGGLLAGTALSANTFSQKKCQVIGGEPFGADDAYHSLKEGRIMSNEKVNTIADGLRTQLGDKNFPIIKEYVGEIVRVDDRDAIFWMRFLWQRMKIVIEPSSAVTVAAAFQYREKFSEKKVGVILSGGNVDLDRLPWLSH